MKKKEAQELETQIGKSKLADANTLPPKEQPLGFDFKQGGVVVLNRDAYLYLVNVLKPFQFLGNILDQAKDNAVATGQIIPFYEADVKEAQKNEVGQIVNYILRDDFGVETKKDNSVDLVSLTGEKLASKSN